MQASACSLITLFAMSFSAEMGTGSSSMSVCDTEECKVEYEMSMSLLQTLSLVSSDSQALTSPTNPSNRASNRTALVSMHDRKKERCPDACVESGADDEYKAGACTNGFYQQPECSDWYQEEDGGWAKCPKDECDACFGCTPPQPSQGAPCPPLPEGVVDCSFGTSLGLRWFSSTDFGIDPTWICRSLGYDGAKNTLCSSNDTCTYQVGSGTCGTVREQSSGRWERALYNNTRADPPLKTVTWRCEGTKMCSPTTSSTTSPTSHEDNSNRVDESQQPSHKCPNGYNPSDNSVISGREDKSNRADESLQSCADLCDASSTCQAFEFSATPGSYWSFRGWKSYEKCYTFNGNYKFQTNLLGILVKHPPEWQTCIRID